MSTLIWRNRMMPRDPRNDAHVRIVRELDRSEVDAVTGPMFRVEATNGHRQWDAFGDELIITKDHVHVWRGVRDFSPPSAALNLHLAHWIGRATDLHMMTVRGLAHSVPIGTTFADFVRICEQEGHR